MKKIVLASNNKHKIAEIKQIIDNCEILTMEEVGYFDDIVEDGTTFFENAMIKAKTVSEFLRKKNISLPVLADDSGLCVEVLGGEPGIYSARYAGKHGNTQQNRVLLLKKLADKTDRDAYFICSMVLYYPDGKYFLSEGKTFGKILTEEVGKKDFGFDCLFYSDDLKKSFGEAEQEEKNSVSHRYRALQGIKKHLDEKDK